MTYDASIVQYMPIYIHSITFDMGGLNKQLICDLYCHSFRQYTRFVYPQHYRVAHIVSIHMRAYRIEMYAGGCM